MLFRHKHIHSDCLPIRTHAYKPSLYTPTNDLYTLLAVRAIFTGISKTPCQNVIDEINTVMTQTVASATLLPY